jgi:hypothetical protein
MVISCYIPNLAGSICEEKLRSVDFWTQYQSVDAVFSVSELDLFFWLFDMRCNIIEALI